MADPITNAKMIGLLALLDVLTGEAKMTAVGADKVGGNDAHGRAGQIRLRFTIFGNESRLLALAAELVDAHSDAELLRRADEAMGRDEKLRLAARMIALWTEVMQRLLAERELPTSAAQLPALKRCSPSDPCPNSLHCLRCGPGAVKRESIQRELGAGPAAPPAISCHTGNRCSNWPQCEFCGPPRQ
jgi:hypothetical protein